jgi:hypothetical protein
MNRRATIWIVAAHSEVRDINNKAHEKKSSNSGTDDVVPLNLKEREKFGLIIFETKQCAFEGSELQLRLRIPDAMDLARHTENTPRFLLIQ